MLISLFPCGEGSEPSIPTVQCKHSFTSTLGKSLLAHFKCFSIYEKHKFWPAHADLAGWEASVFLSQLFLPWGGVCRLLRVCQWLGGHGVAWRSLLVQILMCPSTVWSCSCAFTTFSNAETCTERWASAPTYTTMPGSFFKQLAGG